MISNGVKVNGIERFHLFLYINLVFHQEFEVNINEKV